MEPRIDLPPALSVVVPCYNEAETIGELHRRLDAVCRDLRQKYEIVLVDDGSRDATWSLIEGLAARDPALRGSAARAQSRASAGADRRDSQQRAGAGPDA